MSIRQYLIRRLRANGLSEEDAFAVLRYLYKRHGFGDASLFVWLDSSHTIIPMLVLRLLRDAALNAAVEWMDEKHPQHPARVFFEDIRRPRAQEHIRVRPNDFIEDQRPF